MGECPSTKVRAQQWTSTVAYMSINPDETATHGIGRAATQRKGTDMWTSAA
jgi:hypothetical protein